MYLEVMMKREGGRERETRVKSRIKLKMREREEL